VKVGRGSSGRNGPRGKGLGLSRIFFVEEFFEAAGCVFTCPLVSNGKFGVEVEKHF